jgi:hypothetical protein
MYDFAMIGDNVYIGGLQGENFELINNKIGTLKKIYCVTSEGRLSYLANIEIDELEFPIDLGYVYKLNNVIIDPIFLDNNVVNELFQYHSINEAMIGVNEKTNHRVALCKTTENLNMMLTLSTLN